MRQRFVVRLMSDSGEMLAWANQWAQSRPQRPRAGSCPFYAEEPTRFVITLSGRATQISVHWCDLDVVRVMPIVEVVQVQAGQVFSFGWVEPVWLVHGERDVVLPTVTEIESVTIGVPTGGLGVKAP